MAEAPNLKQLADHPPDRWRGDVTSFVKKHVGLIRKGYENEHQWVTIYQAAVADGCPSKNVQSFTRIVKKVLGLDAAKVASTKGELDHPKSLPTVRRSPRDRGLSSLTETRPTSAKRSNSSETKAPIKGATSAGPQAGELDVKSARGSGAVAMLRNDDTSARVPATPSAAEAPTESVHRDYVKTRQSSAPPKTDPEYASWHKMDPRERANLLKEAM